MSLVKAQSVLVVLDQLENNKVFMKKLLLSLLCASILGTATAANVDNTASSIEQVQLKNNEIYQVKPTDYIKLETPLSLVPVTEFFSFRCVYCYLYNEKLNIGDYIKKNALNNTDNFSYNNVDFMLRDGSDITRFYIASTLKGREFSQKFSSALYEGFHVKNNINSSEDIMKIFEDLGLTKAELQELILDPQIEEIYQQETEKAKKLNLKSTPTFVVNGKYALDMKSIVEGIKEPAAQEDLDLKLQEVRDRINTVITHLLSLE